MRADWRFAFAMWIWRPCEGFVRKLREGAASPGRQTTCFEVKMLEKGPDHIALSAGFLDHLSGALGHLVSCVTM